MDSTHDIKYNNLSHLLWAKTSENNYHPLVYHSLDIAATAEILIKKYFSPAGKQFIKNYFIESDKYEIEKFLIYFAALHDIGKATPVFQAKNDFMKKLLEERGYSFEGLKSMPEDIRHNFLSEWWVSKNITKLISQEIDPETLSTISRAIGGHHGVFSKPNLRKKITPRQFGLNSIWEESRENISNVIKEVLNIDAPQNNNPICIRGSKIVFTYWFAGLITLADWIASMDEYFTFNNQIQDFYEYYQKSQEIAEKALNNSGFNQWNNPEQLQPFNQLFFGYSPRIQQTTVFDVIEKEIDHEKTALIIIEAPMGIGKTETAFYAAELLNSKSEQTGVFIGMPTQATSNQMYMRYKNFLETRLPKKIKGNIELLHSASTLFLADSKKMPVIEGVAIEESDENILSNDWFKPKKRGLLSQFAVGTVDQLLMGVLQTKHNYLRLFGLTTKTVILDEVHSYDLYMNGLLQRFLNWASKLEINVIILSATLPKSTTEKLAQSYSKNLEEISFVEYPRVTVSQVDKTVSYKLEPPEKKPVNLEYLNDFSPEKLCDILTGSFNPDGCIAIICNSVKKSQEFYELFKSKFKNTGIKVLLLHSRFTAQRRNEIERELLSNCGKGAIKPNRILVIATQIIEQSLDIDFDLIITELAPIDLFIQRLGRLHRFSLPYRPSTLLTPKVIWFNENQNFNNSVYNKYLLLRTFIVINNLNTLVIPDDIETLIEKVYSESDLDYEGEYLEKFKVEFYNENKVMEMKAENKLILKPDDEENFTYDINLIDDEDPSTHEDLAALTRLGSPSIRIVCVNEIDNELYLINNLNTKLDLEKVPDIKMVSNIFQAVVPVSSKRIFHYLVSSPATEIPQIWKKNGALRYLRIVKFIDGVHSFNNIKLFYDNDKGLFII